MIVMINTTNVNIDVAAEKPVVENNEAQFTDACVSMQQDIEQTEDFWALNRICGQQMASSSHQSEQCKRTGAKTGREWEPPPLG